MDFKTLFSILKKHLGDGDTAPYFFRELIAMITAMPEEEFGSERDPSASIKDETIRNYIKRGLSTRFARKILYRLTSEILVERIEERGEEVCKSLAEDLRAYDATLNSDNVADAVANWLVDIIRDAAGHAPQDAMQMQKQQQMAIDLKRKYGDYLCNEASGFCPFPGCGKQLTVANNGKIVSLYEVSLIDKQEAAEPDNLIAMCPNCYAAYLLDDRKTQVKKLKIIKKTLSAHRQSVQLLDSLPLEKGIIGVISRIQNLKLGDMSQLSLDPKEIKEKIDPLENYVLYTTVKNYVTTYFLRIREIMLNLDKSGEIDYVEVQKQINTFYRKLKKANKSQIEIFNEIADKIHHVTMQDEIYCHIVVSYFVQSCEVFDAITQ